MITAIAPFYLPLYPQPILISSLLAQTSPDWEALCCHDGSSPEWERAMAYYADPRIRYRSTRDRIGKYGHPLRAAMLDEELHGRYVILSNGDNYLMPMAVARIEVQTADVVCWPIPHSYYGYTVLHPKLELGSIDLCQVAVRTDIAKEVGFPWECHAADWLYIQAVAQKTSDWIFLSDCLAVHN